MARPTLHANLLAELTSAAPARLVRKLDKEPDRAESWSWTETEAGWTIDAGKAVVTLIGGALTTVDHVGCDCLLAPRCLHLLSVLARLELLEGEEQDVEPVAEAVSQPEALTAKQKEAARDLHSHLVGLLESGFQSAGMIAQGQLLRDAHRCRAEKLPRLAGHAHRITVAVKAMGNRDPDFVMGELAAEVGDALEVSRRVGCGVRGPDDVGIGRRRYQTVGGLRLTGLFCEPVLTRSGYAGTVTTLVGPAGRLFTVSDVRPGEPGRALATYRAGVDFAGTSVSHHDLCRTGLFIAQATASASGRLGRGKQVEAVRAGASVWPDELFEVSATEQVGRVLDHTLRAVDQRPEGWDLVFVEGQLRGGQLFLDGAAVPTRLPSDSEHLRYRENQRVLSGLEGSVRVIARWRGSALEMLALSPLDDALDLDPVLGGRVNLGFDRLPGASVQRSVPGLRFEPLDPAGVLRRRVFRVLLGGAAAMPASAGVQVSRDAARLERLMLPTAASLLLHLHEAAGRGPRGTEGAGTPDELARMFSAACTYERTLQRHLLAAAWADSGLQPGSS